jgi:hypothetical protein
VYALFPPKIGGNNNNNRPEEADWDRAVKQALLSYHPDKQARFFFFCLFGLTFVDRRTWRCTGWSGVSRVRRSLLCSTVCENNTFVYTGEFCSLCFYCVSAQQLGNREPLNQQLQRIK